MNFSRSMIVKCILVGVCVLLVPYLNSQRDYFAIGGEIFLPLFPLIIWELLGGLKKLLVDFYVPELKSCVEKGGENK